MICIVIIQSFLIITCHQNARSKTDLDKLIWRDYEHVIIILSARWAWATKYWVLFIENLGLNYIFEGAVKREV